MAIEEVYTSSDVNHEGAKSDTMRRNSASRFLIRRRIEFIAVR